MSNLNVFVASGNLVKDPELVGEEGNVVRFTIAINNGYGERKTTTFVDCVGFGKQAAVIANNFAKGKEIIVRGSLNQSRWETAEGEKRSRLEVRLDSFNGFSFTSGSPRTEPVEAAEDATPEEESTVSATEGSGNLF